MSEPEYRLGWNAFKEAHEAATAPSFDCARAYEQVDRLICASPNLARLDSELTDDYNYAISHDPVHAPDIKNRQIDWWKNRQECARSLDPLACVENAFRARIAEISGGSVSTAPSSRTETTPRTAPRNPELPSAAPKPPTRADFEQPRPQRSCKEDVLACKDITDAVNNFSGTIDAQLACTRAANASATNGNPEWGWLLFFTSFLIGPEFESDFKKISEVIQSENGILILNAYGGKTKQTIFCNITLKDAKVAFVFYK